MTTHFVEQDPALEHALRESAAEAAEALERQTSDAALQWALRESGAISAGPLVPRRLKGSHFFPTGLQNCGNSCFWNALVQVLFAATPIFRGALFQEQQDSDLIQMLRNLFAEMEMGLGDRVDAAVLYKRLFETGEEADVNEQMHRLFHLLGEGPGALRAVFQELFSGDLHEHLQDGTVRCVPLDFCQLNLVVTSPSSLEEALEEHTRDVLGSMERRSYRLPPVLWVNVDRFEFDRETQRGRKLQVRLTFPLLLNAWMLMPPEAEWLGTVRRCAQRRKDLLQALDDNCAALALCSPAPGRECADEAQLAELVEKQESLRRDLQAAQADLERHGAEQELLYELQAVIVHRGQVDTGHYYAFARSDAAEWWCFNDASVTGVCIEEMLEASEGAAAQGQRSSGGLGKGGQMESFGPSAFPADPAVPEVTFSETVRHVHSSSCTEVTADKQGTELRMLVVPPELPAPQVAVKASEVDATVAQSRSNVAPKKVAAKPKAKRRPAFWTMFGCFPAAAAVNDVYEEDNHNAEPETYPAAAGQSPQQWCQVPVSPPGPQWRKAKGQDLDAPPSVEAFSNVSLLTATGETAAPAADVCSAPDQDSLAAAARVPEAATLSKSESSTAARCLVYVRAGGREDLLDEVRRRVPATLQRRIDASNTELLQASSERVVDDFISCVRRLTAHGAATEEETLPDALEATLRSAEMVRTQGGMARARVYLLRACWLRTVPWLPEELDPLASPPDCRMHYGATAKRLLLDALIKRGQHDMASLITSGTTGSDSFVPPDAAAWFAVHKL